MPIDIEALRQRAIEGQEGPGPSPTPAPGTSPPNVQGLQQRSGQQEGAPFALPEQEPEALRQITEAENHQEPSVVQQLGQKVIGRLFGTDVNDPLEWTRLFTTVSGAVAGGITGSRFPGSPVTKAIGAAVGSTATALSGAIAPETTLEAIEGMGFLPPGTRDRLGLSEDDMRTVLEGELLLEAVTMGGVSLARGIGRGLTKTVTGLNRETARLSALATREGIAMLPVQVGERRLARGFVSIMGRFPLVAAGLKKRGERSMQRIQRMFDGIPERLGPLSTFDDASGEILRDARHTSRMVSNHYNQQFNEMMGMATARGIKIMPTHARTAATRILKSIGSETPKGLHGEALPIPKDLNEIRTFINKTVKPLYDEMNIVGADGFPQMTYKQADTLITNIHQAMAKIAGHASPRAMQHMEDLIHAVEADMLNPLGPKMKPRARGNYDAADLPWNVSAALYGVNDDMTRTIADVFDNMTARKMGLSIAVRGRSVIDKGIPQGSPHSLARVLLTDGGPEVVDEIARMTRPETMQRLGSAVFSEALQKSYRHEAEGVTRFDVDDFAKHLGLDAPNSTKFAQTERLLSHTGGLSMPELRDFVEIARRASRAEIPDVSTFIARRGTIGGIKGVVNAVMPFAVVGGVGTAGAAAGAGYTAGIVAIGGSFIISQMISNPRTARALRAVIDESTVSAVKRAAAIRAFTQATSAAVSSGDMSKEEATEKTMLFGLYANELHNGIQTEDKRRK